MESIQDTIAYYNREAQKFRQTFIGCTISAPFKMLGSFESYVLQNSADLSVPAARKIKAELDECITENSLLKSNLNETAKKLKIRDADENEIKSQLGDKYVE